MTTIFNEMNSLPLMRVQKVFGLSLNVLVLELYSAAHKRLFLVFDPNALTRSFHLQREKPLGQTRISPLVLTLRKYAEGRSLWFVGDHCLMKAIIRGKEEDLVLGFSFSPFSVQLTRAPAKTHAVPDRSNSSLDANLLHAKRYNEQRAEQGIQKAWSEGLRELAHLIKKKTTLLKNLEKDLLKAKEILKKEGDISLIKSNMHSIKKGAHDATLMDYSLTPPCPRKVAIDPRLPIQSFVEQFYSKIKRAKRGINHIEPRKEQLLLEIAQLKQTQLMLKEKGSSAITEPSKNTAIKNKKITKRISYKKFISSDGIAIWVGKSAKDNDDLTLHHALGNEWWFHAQTAAGAHVVVKSQQDALPSPTLVEAAMLAAHFSALKDESSPEVIYTRIKYVRKTKGLPPGKVLITHERSLFVRMDATALKSLIKQGSL